MERNIWAERAPIYAELLIPRRMFLSFNTGYSSVSNAWPLSSLEDNCRPGEKPSFKKIDMDSQKSSLAYTGTLWKLNTILIYMLAFQILTTYPLLTIPSEKRFSPELPLNTSFCVSYFYTFSNTTQGHLGT